MFAAVVDVSPRRICPPVFEPAEADADAACGWPLLATPVPTGFPSPADDRVEHRLSLDAHLIRNPESTFLARASGNSLAAAGIRDGDLLVVDRAVPPTTGSIVVVSVEGAFALRWLGRDAEGRRVASAAHPDAPDRLLGDDQELTIWGVVRWVVRRAWPGLNGQS